MCLLSSFVFIVFYFMWLVCSLVQFSCLCYVLCACSLALVLLFIYIYTSADPWIKSTEQVGFVASRSDARLSACFFEVTSSFSEFSRVFSGSLEYFRVFSSVFEFSRVLSSFFKLFQAFSCFFVLSGHPNPNAPGHAPRAPNAFFCIDIYLYYIFVFLFIVLSRFVVICDYLCCFVFSMVFYGHAYFSVFVI